MVPDASSAKKILRRMALEIAERNHDCPGIVLIGIKENGAVIARAVARELGQHYHGVIETADLGIDKKKPGDISLTPDVNVTDKVVVLADDVANSGRTMLYAMKPLLDKHPSEIQTLAFVERTHKHFPIALNYVGVSLSTTAAAHITVEVNEHEITAVHYQPSTLK